MSIKLGAITLFDVKELSKSLDVTSFTLRNYIRKGRLKGQKMGGKWYLSEDSLREFFLKSQPKRSGIKPRGVSG